MAAITHRLRCEMLERRMLAAADVAASLGLTVESSGTQGMRAAEIQLQYNPHALTLEANDIRPGSAWNNQASLISHIDDTQGSVNIFLFSVEPIEGEDGNLVDLQFDVSDQVIADLTLATISQVRLNEGAIESVSQIRSLGTTTQVSASTGTASPEQAEGVDTPEDTRACRPWPTLTAEQENPLTVSDTKTVNVIANHASRAETPFVDPGNSAPLIFGDALGTLNDWSRWLRETGDGL